jgi:hypothetical protein
VKSGIARSVPSFDAAAEDGYLVPFVYGAICIALVVGSVAVFAGRPAGAWAIALLGLGMVAAGFNGRIYSADVWLVGGAIAAGLAGAGVRALRAQTGERAAAARGILRLAAGGIGVALALLAAGLVWFSAVGLS